VLIATGCGRQKTRIDSLSDPLNALRGEPQPYAVKGRMYLTVKAPRWGMSGTASSTMLVHRPDEFFLQVRGPLGNTMLQATCDASEVTLQVPSMKRFLVGENPESAMRQLTGGAVGLDGLLALLMARLPNEKAEIVEIGQVGKNIEAMMEAPNGYLVKATVERLLGRLLGVELYDPAGELLLTVSYEDWFRDARSYYPELVTLEIPGIDLWARADFQAWEVMGEVPDIFSASPPANITPEDLQQSLREGVKSHLVDEHPPQ